MRRNTPSTSQERRRRRQRGQAMVLNAMTLVILFGMIGLAIDGGRLYWERRMLQNAVDAAALSASDNYQDSASVSNAVTAAANEYAADERIYSTATVSGSGSNWQASWSTSPDVMKVTYTASGAVSSFAVSSTHTIQLAFMVVLGAGSTATVSTTATGHARTGGTSGAALITLSQGNCTGSGTSISTGGGGSSGGFTINGGDVRDNGAVSLSGSHVTINTSGNWYQNCTCPVPSNITTPGTKTCGAAPIADPAFSKGPTSFYSTAQPAPGSPVNLSPGVYSSTLSGSSSCYFLAPGIYTLNAGYGANKGLISNYLRPPDEPAWNTTTSAPDYTTVTSTPLWSGCAGSFSVAAYSDVLSLGVGSWGAIVTATRTDAWPPAGQTGSTNYLRESFPSACHAVSLSAGQGVQVTINNLPGATGYNVYLAYNASGNACSNGKWGYATSVSVPTSCASPCVSYAAETTSSMGSETVKINTSILGIFQPTPTNITAACDFTSSSPYSVGCAAATGLTGSANPPGDGGPTAPESSGIYTSDPSRDIVANGGGDRANARDCMPRGTNASAPCAGAFVTPGAVQLYFPAGTACISQSSNETVPLFGGYQFNWIALYGDAANACKPSIAGSGGLRLKGGIYWPNGQFSTQGNGLTSIASEVVVWSIQVGGSADTIITLDYYAIPVQGYSQLSQ